MTDKNSEATDQNEGEASDLNALLCGSEYNFKHQPERLRYMGKHKGWNQFEKIGELGIWCELLDTDLHMIEKTKISDEQQILNDRIDLNMVY